MDHQIMSNQTGTWTNEKHVHFLNSMEASFVRSMLENNGSRLLRLDRYLPDSSESTLDLKLQGRKKQAVSDIAASRIRMDSRIDNRTRKTSTHHHHHYYDTSQDQVVPQLEKRAGDKDGRDPPHTAAAASAN